MKVRHLVLLLLVACSSNPSLVNITGAPVISSKELVSNEDVGQAITRAARKLGWITTNDGPGKITATHQEKRQRAVVGIEYQIGQYSIRYKESDKLNYRAKPLVDMTGAVHDPHHATIDSIYNTWIRALDIEIQRELSSM